MRKHNSVVTKEIVNASVQAKLDILSTWVGVGKKKESRSLIPWLCDTQGKPVLDAKGEKQLDYFPKDLRAFCLWNGSQNCAFVRDKLPSFKTTNRSTISQSYHALLRISIEATLDCLREKSVLQLLESNKAERIEQLEAQVELLKALNTKQRNEILQYRNLNSKIEIKFREKDRALNTAKVEYAQMVKRLESKNAELVSLLIKIKPLSVKA